MAVARAYEFEAQRWCRHLGPVVESSAAQIYVFDALTGRCLYATPAACVAIDTPLEALSELNYDNLFSEPFRPSQNGMPVIMALERVSRDGRRDRVSVCLMESVADESIPVHLVWVRPAAADQHDDEFRQLLESAPDAIVIIAADGHVHLVNRKAEEMFGYTRHELLGQAVERLMPERYRTMHVGHRAAYTAQPHTRPMGGGMELYAVRKDGGEFPVEISLSPMQSRHGMLVTSVIRDITDRKRAQDMLTKQAQELARSNAELEQFAYVASHDLQEPLRMITSYVQLLAKRYRGKLDEEADEFIHYAVDGANRMQTLIEDLLSYSRVSRLGQDMVATDADSVLDDVLRDLNVTISEAQAEVTHDALPRVRADASQLRQLFQNLLSNALKFRSDKAPAIQVTAQRKGSEWQFCVSDNGIGIEPQYHERIFVIFQRLHAPGRYSGTGIGLAICKRIVERHGGKLWMTSEPGVGTTFSFTLPAVEGE